MSDAAQASELDTTRLSTRRPSSRLRHPLLWMLLGYLGLGLTLLPAFQFQINPDGIAYLDIAEKYARGDLGGAINAYWGPLLSWLTAALRVVGLPPQIAVKLALLGSGAAALAGLWALTRGYPVWTRIVAVAAAVPMTLRFALSVITPDLVVAAALAWYLSFLVSRTSPPSWRRGLGCGALGALAYMAKAFALPFFLAHWALWGFLQWRRRRVSAASFVAGLASFCALSGLWIVALRWKYGVWMTGSAGRYNQAWAGPRMAFAHPMEKGFWAPFEPGDTSAWTDPTRLPIQPWSVFESPDFAWYQLVMTLERLRVIACDFLPELFPLALPLLLVALVVAWRQAETETGRRCRAALSAIAIYLAGYALIYVEARHLWTLAYLFCAMVVWLFAGWIARGPRAAWSAALALCAIALAWQPAQALRVAAQGKDEGLETCRGLYRAAQAMRKQLGVRGRLASSAEWHYSLYLTYFLGGRYYGVAPAAAPDAIARALDAHQIDYYLAWSDELGEFPSVVWGTEITGGGDPRLRIYQATSGSTASH
ncbi:MAG: hypothetical protein CFK52_00080 [Chloracidobacterium sp. CP2_5A]|nr:MAG: hypothetical protein CFK52_00080 [Chloracidobacterium sp. CP2_5A]